MSFERLRKQPWFLIILTTIIALAAAFAYLQQTTPIYMSTSRIRVEVHRPLVGNEQERIPEQQVGQNFRMTQAALITCRANRQRALDDPNMQTLSGGVDPDYVAKLASTLTAIVEGHSDVIRVSASSRYPEDAATFVNAVVQAYIRYHDDRTRSTETEEFERRINEMWEQAVDELEACRRELAEKRERLQKLEESQRAAGQVEANPEEQKEREQLMADCKRLEDECNALARLVHSRPREPPVTWRLDIHILQKAVAASKPFKPHKARIVGLAALVGLFGGAILTLIARMAVSPLEKLPAVQGPDDL